ncbi:MAG: DUF3400 domain-containing protein, partial [Zetaproteobacteria bacterium]
ARVLNQFYAALEALPKRQREAKKAFAKATHPSNIHFDPYTLAHHATDATDWRSHLPFAVLTPDSAEELLAIIPIARRLGLKLIPRGGGTGLCGGSVPLDDRSVVVNLEKLDWIGPVQEKEVAPGVRAPTIRAGAGAVTGRVMEAARPYIFATDPTSLWACTIGGNIATNAGGKHAVLWGTCLDNLLSWKLITPAGEWLTVRRLAHNLGKIHELNEVRFLLTWEDVSGRKLREETLVLPGSAFRAPGLGKDVTKKALGGLPGIQKEGTDGFIVEGEFVLHKPFAHTRTVCCEFFGHDLARATEALVEIKARVDAMDGAVIEALEHFDEKYVKAIDYVPKSTRGRRPKAVLLIDVSGDDEKAVAEAASEITRIAARADGEGFVAVRSEDRARFWADRGRLAAIAKHTRAFKLNEDVVIPLARLAEYSDFVERLNIEYSLENKLEALERIAKLLAQARAEAEGDRLERAHVGADADAYTREKIDAALRLVEEVRARWARLLRGLDEPAGRVSELLDGVRHAADEPLWRVIQRGDLVVSYRREVRKPLREILRGHEALLAEIDEAHREVRSGRIVIATHMHAGDGNVHTNIPVNSNDYAMMKKAHAAVAKVMAKAVELGGVISGEHGIGITKLPFMPRKELEAMRAYLARMDPDDLFNPGKLQPDLDLSLVFTPSFNLMELESTVLEAADLTEMVDTISPCLRCGKCKPVCSTHVPRANLLYSPRNKIMAAGMLIEAFLYEAQTKEGISYDAFAGLNEIADHCTICHKCLDPCPVNIDFGEITSMIRAQLRARGQRRESLGAKTAMAFLNLTEGQWVHLMRNGALAAAYRLQRWGHRALRLVGLAGRTPSAYRRRAKPAEAVVAMFERPLPEIRWRTARQLLGIGSGVAVPVLRDPKRASTKAVFYFPGCGSERLFPEIALATEKLLFDLGYQVVLPPGYRCCGYPQRAAGEAERARAISYENRVLMHRLRQALAYLDFEAVIVSCGTCYDQLLGYELGAIFPEAPLVDIHEFLAAKGVEVPDKGGKYLYHDPCHVALKRHGSRAAIQKLLGAEAVKSERCCGEAGTLAASSPAIAAKVRAKKEEETQKALEKLGERSAKILTSCPACLQGLRRLEGALPVSADYIVVELARRQDGEDWQRRFIERVKRGGVETVLL